MTIMIASTVLTVIAGTFGGAIAGVSLACWYLRLWMRRHDEIQLPFPEPDVEVRIQSAAQDWATTQGQPEATPLVANKLQLVHRLRHQRSGWWST